jgi:hypothetical protein
MMKLARENIEDAAPAEAPWDVDDAKWGWQLLSRPSGGVISTMMY